MDLDAQRDLPSDDNYSLTNAGVEALDDGGDQRDFGDLPVEIPPDASVSWRIPAMPIVQSSAEPTSIAIDLTPPPDSMRDGTLHPTWTLRVIDDASGEVVCQGSTSLACTIPGLATGAAPRALTVYAITAAMPALTVTFGPATFTMQTADGEPLTYTSESMTWAAGDQDLPGPK